jgi:hypothetical protein
MAKNSTLTRSTGFVLLAIALLALTAFLILSGANPALAGEPDSNPPGCLYTVPVVGDARIKVLIRDTESGLAGLEVTNSKNLEGWVFEDWTVGQTGHTVISGDVDNEASNARINVRAWDVAGNVANCVGNYFAPPPP